MNRSTPGGLPEKHIVSLASDNSTRDGIIARGLSDTGRTFRAVIPKTRVEVSKSKQRTRKMHYDTKTDVRLSRHTSEELDKIADYARRSKSDVIRQFIEDGVKSTKKEQGYKRYLKKLDKMEEKGKTRNPDDYLIRHRS